MEKISYKVDAKGGWYWDSHLKSKRRPVRYEGGSDHINWEDWKDLSRGHFKGNERIHEKILLHDRILKSWDFFGSSEYKRRIGKKPEYQFFEWVKRKINEVGKSKVKWFYLLKFIYI